MKQEILRKIMLILRDPNYIIKSYKQLSLILKVNEKTIIRAINKLKELGVVLKDPETQQYYWSVVPTKFYNSERDRYETYINALENRLIKYKWQNRRVNDTKSDNLPALIKLLEECEENKKKILQIKKG